MKGLTTLALLIGTLFVPALHAEEPTAQGDATPPLTFPLSTTDAPATPDNTASDTPATENSPAAQPSQQTAAPATTTAPETAPQPQDVSDALPAMPPVTPAASGFMPPADSSLSFAGTLPVVLPYNDACAVDPAAGRNVSGRYTMASRCPARARRTTGCPAVTT